MNAGESRCFDAIVSISESKSLLRISCFYVKNEAYFWNSSRNYKISRVFFHLIL